MNLEEYKKAREEIADQLHSNEQFQKLASTMLYGSFEETKKFREVANEMYVAIDGMLNEKLRELDSVFLTLSMHYVEEHGLPPKPGIYWVLVAASPEPEKDVAVWNGEGWKYSEIAPDHLWGQPFGGSIIAWIGN